MPKATPHPLRSYAEAVSYLESLLHPITGVVPEGGLRNHFQRMGYFLDRLGQPQHRFPTVHIAGTSGKGSTTTMIGAILSAAGFRTGVHCTPYLQTPIERMQLDSLLASPTEFTELVNDIRPHIEHMERESPYHGISYREIAVAQAFLYFATKQVDIAAIETGMGGRYDYTNHIRPLAAAIVTVDFDHVLTLGPSLESIAYHKAGIIKPGVPVVTGVHEGPALRVIEREAEQQGTALYRVGAEIRSVAKSVGGDGSVFDYESPWGMLTDLHVAMLGRHQIMNATIAVSVAQLLRQRGFVIGDEAIRRGLSQARMAGRLEIVDGAPTVILDGAHNPEKMRSLALALKELFPQQKPVLIVGILAAKQAQRMLVEVVPLARHVFVTSPLVLGKPAVPVGALAAVCRQLGADVTVEPDLRAAVERARERAGPKGLVCVTGSLYMVGQVREFWVPTERVIAQRTLFPNSLPA